MRQTPQLRSTLVARRFPQENEESLPELVHTSAVQSADRAAKHALRVPKLQTEPVLGASVRRMQLSDDLHPSVVQFFTQRTEHMAATDGFLSHLAGGVVMQLSTAARTRLGCVARTWLCGQVLAIELIRMHGTCIHVVFELKLESMLSEVAAGDSGFALRDADGTPVQVARSHALAAPHLQEWLQGLSELHRSTAQQQWRYYQKPIEQGGPAWLEGAVNLAGMAHALVQAAAGAHGPITAVGNRVFSLTGLALAAEVPDLSTQAYLLAKRHTAAFRASALEITSADWQQFENVVASTCLEGCAVVSQGSLPVYQRFAIERLYNVYLPLYLMALQEYSVLTRCLTLRGQGQHDVAALHQIRAALTHFNLSCRFPIVSQLAHHGAFYRNLRLALGNQGLVRDLEGDEARARVAIEHHQELRRHQSATGKLAKILAVLGYGLIIFHLAELPIQLYFDHSLEIGREALLVNTPDAPLRLAAFEHTVHIKWRCELTAALVAAGLGLWFGRKGLRLGH